MALAHIVTFVYYTTVSLVSIFGLIVTWLAYEFIKLKRLHQTFKRLNIPGPEPSLLDGGNQGQIARALPKDIFYEWTQKYGKVYGYYSGDILNIVISDIELAKAVFIDNQHIFPERHDSLVKVQPMWKGILFAERERWRFFRKVWGVPLNFYGSKAPNAMEILRGAVDKLHVYLEKNLQTIDGKRIAKNIDARQMFETYAVVAFTEFALPLEGAVVGPENSVNDKLFEFLTAFNEDVRVCQLPFLKKYFEWRINSSEFDTIMSKIFKLFKIEIEKGLAYLNKEKEIGKQIKSADDEGEDELNKVYNQDGSYIHAFLFRMIKFYWEGKMTYEELRANCELTILAAYAENSRTYLYLVWTIAKHQDVQEKLRQELIQMGTDSPYLLQVIKESMRRYPTVASFIRRKANRAVRINGINFPKGVNAVYHAQSVYHDPNVWPDPLTFNPDRFKEGNKIHPGSYAPFGFGEKMCVGYKYAMNSLKNTFTDLVLHYKIKLIAPQEISLKILATFLTEPTEKVVLDFEQIKERQA